VDNTGQTELGEKWSSVLTALNTPARIYLRTNRIKTNRDDLVKALLREQIISEIPDESSASAGSLPGANSDVLRLAERKNVFTTAAFKVGFFEVQDIGSQKIAPFMDVQSGMRVIDACAGGGGKSLHLASLMGNKGKIIALDTNDWRLKPLRQRASRAGADIIETRVIASAKTVKRLHESADRLLLDVPCSGSGVLRRNPDTKWKLSPQEISRLLAVQGDILQRYSLMTARGGYMVYATCSVFPSENKKQIEQFLNSPAGNGWEFVNDLAIIPSAQEYGENPLHLNGDGFYMAKLRRC